jgi:pyrroline-5-carboxylate reductase
MSSLFFIGAGNMGGAILRGLASQPNPPKLLAFDTDSKRQQELRNLGVHVVDSIANGLELADWVFICVKPQVFSTVAKTMSQTPLSGKTMVSIMAGIPLSILKQALQGAQSVVRTMPNIGFTVGAGTLSVALDDITQETLHQLEAWFAPMGEFIAVQEYQMDAVTALSGSGPAFVFQFLEGLIAGGVCQGLTRAQAEQMALGTVRAGLELAQSNQCDLRDLTYQVCSPGGTTIYGIEVLERDAFRHSVMNAVRAASERSQKLSSK